MSLLNFLRRKNDATAIPDRAGIVARYKHLRAVTFRLNKTLVARLSKEILHEGADRLGILQRGVMVFNTEDETSVLMDYCIYDVRRKGRNTLEQYLIDSPPDPESDEMTCLRAMQQAIYSVFVVDSVHRGLGITVRDLLSTQTLLVVDMGLGETARPGLVLASRMLLHDGFAMTGGAALPLGLLSQDRQLEFTNKLTAAKKANGFVDPAPLIRACLHCGSSSQVAYQEASGQITERSPTTSKSRSSKIGRNDPCPCGSGRKFKQCCMGRG